VGCRKPSMDFALGESGYVGIARCREPANSSSPRRQKTIQLSHEYARISPQVSETRSTPEGDDNAIAHVNNQAMRVGFYILNEAVHLEA